MKFSLNIAPTSSAAKPALAALAMLFTMTGCSDSDRVAANEQEPVQTASAPAEAPQSIFPQPQAPQPAPRLEAKVDRPKPKPAPVAARPKHITIPAESVVRIVTTSAISTELVHAGDRFVAGLAEPLVVDGVTVAPIGATAEGIVTSADEGGRVKGVASLALQLTSIEVNGQPVEIESSLFVKNAPATKKKDAVKVGIGAGIGAAIGAIAGGSKGAGIGAASGAGAGSAVVLATRGDPAVIDAESIVAFRLKNPVTVRLN